MNQQARQDEGSKRAAKAAGLADLGKVIPFSRGRRSLPEGDAPGPRITDDDRPAPIVAEPFFRFRLFVLMTCSLALHAALFALLWRAPEPLASIGIETISVEIVLGAQTPAGVAANTSESESRLEASAEPPKNGPSDQTQARTSDEPAEPTASISPRDQLAQRPAAATTQKRVARPTEKPTDNRQTTAALPSQAASGIGRGRSDNDSNYHGIVAAHLARYKQYPAEARNRGEQGVATLAFSLDGSGRVTSSRLVRTSGIASIDREVQAMAQRASPFPPPPSGRPMSFTVPVNFRIQ